MYFLGIWATIVSLFLMFLLGLLPYRCWQHCMILLHSSLCVCVWIQYKILSTCMEVEVLILINILILNGRMMENTQLQGQVPVDLFSLPDLQKVWVSAWSQVAPHSVSLSLRVKKIQTEQTCVTYLNTKRSTHYPHRMTMMIKRCMFWHVWTGY